MEIGFKNNQHFYGVKTYKLSQPVKEAVQNSELLQKLGQNYNISITQYSKKTHDKSFGHLQEYGLKYMIREIVPNLFNKRPKVNKEYISEYALSLKYHANKIGKREQHKEEMISDLVTEIELLSAEDIKSWPNKLNALLNNMRK